MVEIKDKNSASDKDKSFIEAGIIEVGTVKKEGIQIKGKDMLYLNAPEIYAADFKIANCGDGLYFFGGDLFCTYKLLGTIINNNSVIFDYEKYTVTVSWTNGGDGVRTNPTWQRHYKNTVSEV